MEISGALVQSEQPNEHRPHQEIKRSTDEVPVLFAEIGAE